MNLIKQIQLPNGRSTTNLGFGCAGLLRLPTEKRRDALLRTAIETGITHFDVARMYGSGQAEGIVGVALKSFRDRVTLATKFGLPFTASTHSTLSIKSLAKWIINKSPALKNKMRSFASQAASATDQPTAPNTYDAAVMEQSLNQSLAELQTDRVDLFFLHAPGLRDIIAGDLADALRQMKASGKIGAFGISGYRTEIDHYLKIRPDVCGDAIQYHYSVLKNGAEGQPLRHPFTGMFGLLDGPLQQLTDYHAANKAFTNSWSEQLDIDLKIRENVGIVILAIGLILNPSGTVVFFTSDPKRLQNTVTRLTDNAFSEEKLLEFRQAAITNIHAN